MDAVVPFISVFNRLGNIIGIPGRKAGHAHGSEARSRVAAKELRYVVDLTNRSGWPKPAALLWRGKITVSRQRPKRPFAVRPPSYLSYSDGTRGTPQT